MLHTKTKIDFATMPLDELVKHVFPFYTRIDKPTKIPPPPPPPPPPKPHVMPMAPPPAPITDLKNMQPGEFYSKADLIKASELDAHTTISSTPLGPDNCQPYKGIGSARLPLGSIEYTMNGYRIDLHHADISKERQGPNEVVFIELNDRHGQLQTIIIWQKFNYHLFILHSIPYDPNSFIYERNNIHRLKTSSQFMPYKLVPLCLPAVNPACNLPSSTAHLRVSSLPSVRCET